jgi:hypothetical protein
MLFIGWLLTRLIIVFAVLLTLPCPLKVTETSTRDAKRSNNSPMPGDFGL